MGPAGRDPEKPQDVGRERGDFCAERFRVDCVRLEADWMVDGHVTRMFNILRVNPRYIGLYLGETNWL